MTVDWSRQRVLVLAPHPDDEVLGCGGLMSRVKDAGGEVYVHFLTVGDTADFSAAGLSTAAAAFGLVVGTLTIALGLAGTEDYGRGTIPILAQAAYDLGLAAGLLLAGIAFGVTGQPWALALFAVAGLATGLIATNTKYSLAPR